MEELPVLELSVEEDKWRWNGEEEGRFTVRSSYLLIDRIFSSEGIFNEQEIRVFKNIWKSPAPSKVIAFSWKLLRNRIPTRANLAHRGVLIDGGSTDCVHCIGREEVVAHLFLFCDFASFVWKAVFRWLGLVMVIPPSLSVLFDCFVSAAGNKKGRAAFSLIWHATVWLIWRSRNNVIFSNGVIDPGVVVDEIKLASWRWGLSRHKIPVCLFYEWCWDPGLCLRQ
jgi:hypothetical protein